MSKHTPTPWRLENDHDGRHHGVSILAGWECDGTEPYHPLIASALHGRGGAPMEVARANGAFIVRAVNSHDDLLAACVRALAVETSVTQGQENELRVGYLAMLRAAIAKAEGGAS